ncbi:helix-turn-helix transcriptional regulator [Streptomyces morookaense]|uniref:Helix-turn-helix transcriptional regulator n=1 Tax=Streptomyces morookaense TaxID=1970 RepID=A0A7Y7B1C4_STRMO|nr:helix-turn-helix transcriptional regulator [Streptomyces morookaense]NVK77228.1 helix-turn-helix transcriptional regulator [Streptomyces morookaense]
MSEESVGNLLDHLPDFLEILLGPEALECRLAELLAGAEHVSSVLPSALRSSPAAWGRLLAARKHSRVLVEGSTARCRPAVRWLDEVARHGPEIRVHCGLPAVPALPMFVFDGRYSVVPMDRSGARGAALLCKGALATAHRTLFEALWACSLPQETGRTGAAGLSLRELGITTLLLAGATDEQAATRTGVSARTVRTVVARLQRRFGTNSRMALGFRLAGSGACTGPAQAVEPARPPTAGEPPHGSCT